MFVSINNQIVIMDEYIKFIEDNLDKINWGNLSTNPAAIHLIEEMLKTNPDKISWYG